MLFAHGGAPLRRRTRLAPKVEKDATAAAGFYFRKILLNVKTPFVEMVFPQHEFGRAPIGFFHLGYIQNLIVMRRRGIFDASPPFLHLLIVPPPAFHAFHPSPK